MRCKTTEGSLWSNKQRSGNAIHETPYYGSFQPALPEFFIEKYTEPRQTVLDPFGGRATTGVQAALMDRASYSSDLSPYAGCLHYGKHFILEFSDNAEAFLQRKLAKAAKEVDLDGWDHLLPFFHPRTLQEILYACLAPGVLGVDDTWVIRMVVMSILTGHSDGHLSVKSMPPNVQVSSERQIKLNAQHGLQPEYKEVGPRVLAKLQRLIADLTEDDAKALRYKFIPWCRHDVLGEWHLPVDLILFSPPFLDVINYIDHNWIRNEILNCMTFWGDPITMAHHKDVGKWQQWMKQVILSMSSRMRPGGRLAIEAGVVKKDVNLIEYVYKAAKGTPFVPEHLYINVDENHTRTAKTWGVDKEEGTPTQQVLVFRYAP